MRLIARRMDEDAHSHAERLTRQLEQETAFKNVEPFLKRMCMEGWAVVWRTNVLHHCDRARQISTRELDPHVFPDEVDWTTRHAFSGAYDLPRRGSGLEKLLGHMNRSREGRVGPGVGPPLESRLFSRAFSCPTARCFTGGASNVLATLGALATCQPKARGVVAMIRCPEAAPG